MSLTLLFPTETGPTGDVYLKHDKIKIISGHVYRLSFVVRTNLAGTINTKVLDSGGGNGSLNSDKYLVDAKFKTFQFEFTGAITDHNSQIRIQPASAEQILYFDQFRLIDLTLDRKQYRIMRIQGSMFPGSFIQTLSLREFTPAESD